MKKVLLAIALILCMVTISTAAVLDFEDLGYPGQYGELTSYNGFDFNGVNWINSDHYSSIPNYFAGINGQYAIATRNFGDFTIARSTAFTLEGLDVTNSSGNPGYLSIKGYLGADEVALYEIFDTGGGTQFNLTFDDNWEKIDRFVVFADSAPGILGKSIVDDIIYSEIGNDPGPGPVDPVPEPGTLALLIAGLIGMAGLSRKK